MKKLLFTVAAIGCFASCSFPALAQWTTVTGGINYSGGKVGIGNATPYGMLHFVTSHNNRKIVLSSAAGVNNDHEFYGMGTSTDVFRFHIPSATRAYRFFRADDATSSTEIFTVLGSGNVGIGTGSPNAKLQFANTITNRKIVLWEDANNDHQYYGIGVNPSTLRFQLPNSGAAFRFLRGDGTGSSSEIFTLLGTGSVGIGTTNPGIFKLAVEGKVGAHEVQVRTSGSGWADYVFFDNYRLRPLPEVERYVKQNRHLPEVPSAQEVEKNGHNLGQMDAILLKKIEELTLYLIEQQKQLDQLQQQNQVLQQEVQALKK